MFLGAIFGNCTPRLSKFDNLLDGINAKPQTLTMHRDSVRFKLQGAIPLQYLKSDVKILLYPEYNYGDGALRLSEIVAFDGMYTKINNEAKVEANFVFPYLEGMESGELILKGLVMQRGITRNITSKKIADGLFTSSLLARIGQITPDEAIPMLGVYIKSDFSQNQREELQEFVIPFPLASNSLKNNALDNPDGTPMISLTKPGKVLKKIIVRGIHSLEAQELNDTQIASRRSEAVIQKIKAGLNDSSILILSTTRKQDWLDFRVLLADYNEITAAQKDEYYKIILSDKAFEIQVGEIQGLDTYAKVSKALFPSLRAVKISAVFENTSFSDPVISAALHRLFTEGDSTQKISHEQLIYAGEVARGLKEKEQIYSYLNEMNKSELSLNNLGVVYLNQAQRELDLKSKNQLISKAITLFRSANKISPSSFSWHNLGRAYLLRGDYYEAYVAVSEASSLEKDETNDFLKLNEGLRGAMDIINGDYKLATIRFNRAIENESNLFNKGLAYFLAEDYKNAIIAFEESAQYNREYGYGFYGLAMVASITDDKPAIFENLSKAIKRSEYLRERSMTDLMFKKYKLDPEFVEMYK